MENEETAMRALEAAPEDVMLLERRIRVERAKAHKTLMIRALGEARVVEEGGEEGEGEGGRRWVVKVKGAGEGEEEVVEVVSYFPSRDELDATFVSHQS